MDPIQQQNKLNMSPDRKPGKKSAVIIMTISAIAIIVLIFIMVKGRSDTTVNPDTNTQATSTVSGASTSAILEPKTMTVTLGDSGYTPLTTTINEGDTVTFTNDSSGKMWTASGPHPAHTAYPGFDEKTAANHGESYSFTFTKPGTWSYHNHLNPAQKGTIIVEMVGGKE
ncbi:MAG: cupredoxin domain-containing protein [bacterium]|nr:cupredoxin domain-containing protein [bacterium]